MLLVNPLVYPYSKQPLYNISLTLHCLLYTPVAINTAGASASSHNLETGGADGAIDSHSHLSSPVVAGGKTNNSALHELLTHTEQFEQYVANLSTVAGADGKDADENELNLRLRQLNRKLSMHISSSMKALITDEERIALLGMVISDDTPSDNTATV